GRGHSSPTVVGPRVFLNTADEETKVQSVLCYARPTGKLLWKKDLFKGGFDTRLHKRNTHATSTIASDGRLIYTAFMNAGKIWLLALDLEGNEAWKTEITDFESHWGFAT
ncbi:MAG: serine/threonine protein kinase, partial [Verrucomicrobiota bacterium]